jgi:methyl-accepting chemotaxis protein
MFKNINLQTRLIASFILMGLIVLVVGSVGWLGATKLTEHINTFTGYTIPSVIGLWKINEGQTKIQSAERLLLDPEINSAERNDILKELDTAWTEIKEGFKEYESAPRIDEEDKLYKQFQQDWQQWEASHKKFLAIEEQFNQFKIRNPWKKQIALLSKSPVANDPELAQVKQSIALREQMDELNSNQEKELFGKSEKSIFAVLKINDRIAEEASKNAEKDSIQTKLWTLVGMGIGPITAIILGIVLSIGIAKPLDRAIGGIINMIVSSSSEIAASVEEQERIATQQATSVNQTTSTMDELGVSSRQSAEQAESAALDANQVLNLTQKGNQTVGTTLQEISTLQQKVNAIAAQITRLNEQTNQIGSISGLVTDLANQTNMLALNATVEAVRAGESGKGFAVVAAEIRRLADESKKSAEKINNLIVEIKNAINSTVIVSDEGNRTVEQTMQMSQQTVAAFNAVGIAINEIVMKNQQISLTSKQQAIAVEQVVTAMSLLNNAAKENAQGISQIKIGTEQLKQAALSLRSLGLGS